MKKTLALVLALAMVFSTITVAFAEGTLSADAQIAADLGMLKGETGTVDAAYTATTPTRLQAAVMFLRLKGLEAEALAFTGAANFEDGNIAWAEGKNLLAYLKANPQLGWVGDGKNFNPNGAMTAQAYYKVMLETLGYKQTTPEVVGDFAYADTLTFAASKGLTKVAAVANFTVNDLATATVEALKANMKDGGKTLVATLIEAGKVDQAKATTAGLVAEEKPATTAVAVKSAKALGNSVVQVTFEAAVDEAAANVGNYTVEGLEVKAAVVSGEKTVRLTTAAQTVGKVYLLTVGEKTVKFTGIAKVSDGPTLADVNSNDVEEVVLAFDRLVDYETAANVANYTIAGVEIVSAEIDEDEVTLTTSGLKDNTTYKVKASNIKSVDGVLRKAATFEFKSDYDTAAPRINGDVVPQTNERFLLYFDEDVTEESAEDLANYSIVDEDGNELAIVSVSWNVDSDDDNENDIEVITETQTDNEEYTLKISNIADQRKVANVMKRTLSEKFDGMDEDTQEPDFEDLKIISKNKLIITFSDDSKLDAESILATNSYTLTDDDDNYMDVENVETLTDENGEFEAVLTVEDLVAGEKYDLEIVDILDEFGNSLEKANVDVDPVVGDFSTAALTSWTFGKKSDETTEVVLNFDMPLVEATAENIAAYSLNNSIGSPTKATYDYDYETDATKVTLIFNELVNGKGYKLTVDGVEDLAGNTLKFVTAKTYANATVVGKSNWDTEAPELKKAYALNKYVVALEFDEEVQFGDADVTLTINDGTDDIDLDAKVTSDGDKVVEFSMLDDNGTAGDTTDDFWVELDPDTEYSVVAITYAANNNIRDLRNNELEEIPADLDSFKGDNSDPDYAEVDDIEMVNGGAFDITMSRNVIFNEALALTDEDNDGDLDDYAVGNGDYIVIEDNVITYVVDGGLDKDDTVTIDLNDFVTDEHGMAVVNDDEDADNTVLESNTTDTKSPIVDNVTALDRTHVEIEFSEDIKVVDVANFDIFNEDDDDARIRIASLEIDGNLVTLTLTDALEGRYEYNLQVTGGVIEDFATNEVAEDNDVYFDGSDAADH